MVFKFLGVIMKPAWVFLLLALCTFMVPGIRAEEEELPSSGFLAGSISSGQGSTAMPGVWGSEGNAAGAGAPIAGSVSLAGNSWSLRLFNNSEEQYSFSVQVLQYSQERREVKKDHFSFSLKGGERVERSIRRHSSATDAAVKLLNWRKIERERSREELKSQIDQVQGELSELQGEMEALED